ncbi:MAG TPA: RDD family protein [Acidimicrobiales bacterium]|nr:RDD family protein [Acidimicrobiales bacterium]
MEPTTGSSRPKASFGLRLGAALIDGIILGVLSSVLRAVIDDALAQVVGSLLGLAYFIYLEGSDSGQTLGKKVVGIRVVDLAGAGPIGYGRATVRYFGRIVSAIALGLGYLWMLWDDQKQTWHDKFATSMVVPVSAYPIGSGAA